ncbi:MAG: hypothetical protein GPJ51_08590 [Candidatus Heimdallarchaeota archaeon]|nr:hypothetical protein [Candidatus Heimdallarchaeota archaeon]
MSRNGPSILVISSCGNLKAMSHPDQPTCASLSNKQQREKAKRKFHKMSVEAGNLYTGEQARFIRKSLEVLRLFSSVEHRILSAGFGLVDEKDLLPPYDCSFTNKTKKDIQIMSRNLSIPDKVKRIAEEKYELVYLALGKDYLTAVGDVDVFSASSRLVVHFNTQFETNAKNILSINQKLFVGRKHNYQIFKVPIGGYIRAKGSLLLNYALDLKEENKTPRSLSFQEWWDYKKSLL